MPMRRSTATALLSIPMMAILAACGEEDQAVDPGGDAAPTRSEERLIEGTQPADQTPVLEDTTPQTSTGGSIPGYDPTTGGTAGSPTAQPQD